MIYLASITTLALLYMLLVALHNLWAFPRLSSCDLQPGHAYPPVSVLIPARNEAGRIGPTLRSLLQSSYPAFEIIILDDASSDSTEQEARQCAGGDARVRVYAGAPLPSGWLGKNWACWQLAQLATHELLLFADADVQWTPAGLTALLCHQQSQSADLLAAWPTQITATYGERLVVPMMAFTLLAYLPAAWVNDPAKVQAAAANGQCLLFRREAYGAIGGHAAVRQSALEDVLLARLTKAAGLRLRLVDGAGLVQCRMYTGLGQAIDGYTKNILPGHADSIPLLLLSTLFHLTIFIGPWLWLGAGTGPGWPLWPLLLIAAGYVVRGPTPRVARLPLRDLWLLPISVLLVTYIALRSIWLRLRHGGPQWKGRRIPLPVESHDGRHP